MTTFDGWSDGDYEAEVARLRERQDRSRAIFTEIEARIHAIIAKQRLAKYTVKVTPWITISDPSPRPTFTTPSAPPPSSSRESSGR